MTLYLLFDANLMQKRPSCTKVQTLICGIYKIKFWIQLLRLFVLSYSTGSNTYLHIPLLLLPAYANVTFSLSTKTPLYVTVKNPDRISPQGCLEKTNPPNSKR